MRRPAPFVSAPSALKPISFGAVVPIFCLQAYFFRRLWCLNLKFVVPSAPKSISFAAPSTPTVILLVPLVRREGKGGEGMRREGKRSEVKGREEKGREEKGREGKRREGKGREGKRREAK